MATSVMALQVELVCVDAVLQELFDGTITQKEIKALIEGVDKDHSDSISAAELFAAVNRRTRADVCFTSAGRLLLDPLLTHARLGSHNTHRSSPLAKPQLVQLIALLKPHQLVHHTNTTPLYLRQ